MLSKDPEGREAIRDGPRTVPLSWVLMDRNKKSGVGVEKKGSRAGKPREQLTVHLGWTKDV